MASKNTADLTTENDNSLINQTLPESITPVILGGITKDIIDSMYNRTDDGLLPAPTEMTKGELAAAITGSELFDKQWIKITDRNDGFPLFVTAQGVDNISPFGIWVKSGKPLAVIMDYVNGIEGETLPFYAYTDGTGIFTTATPIKITDGSQGANKVLTSDVNGQSSWKLASSYQSAILNPASMTGAVALMVGLGGAITPGKSGTAVIFISGEYTSDDNVGITEVSLRVGTGSAPTNGNAVTGTIKQTKNLIAASATARQAFSFNYSGALTPGTAYWVDLSTKNAASGAVRLFNVSISISEQ